jgi:hypothetical protein
LSFKEGFGADDTDIGIMGAGTGLVEIELPSSYKTANIVETSKIRRKQLEGDKYQKPDLPSNTCGNKGKKSSVDLASFRYQKTYATPFIPTNHFRQQHQNGNNNNSNNTDSTSSHQQQSEGNHIPTVPLPNDNILTSMTQGGNTNYAHKNKLRSDDYMVEHFKKVNIFIIIIFIIIIIIIIIVFVTYFT